MYYFLGNVWLIYEHLRLLFVSKTGKKHKFSLLSWPKTANQQICPWWVAMLLFAWSLEPENSTASHLWCGNFTGYQSGKGSGLRQPFCLQVPSWIGSGVRLSTEYCKLTTGRSHLRSANACLLPVPRTRTTYGDRSFAVSGPVGERIRFWAYPFFYFLVFLFSTF